MYDYAGGCDWDVLDDFPSQETFDAKYWNKLPVVIRNGTSLWPARSRWTKAAIIDALSGKDNYEGAAWFRTSDDDASSYVREYFDHNSTMTTIRRKRMDFAEFLCHGVCKPPQNRGLDQKYLFDRDEWRHAAPQLEADTIIPPPVHAHFDGRWHERWSKYLLISAEGSGINFHRHTNAFNGLVRGRKRWFFYPPHITPPRNTLGTLQWYERVYKKEVAKPGRHLTECMQGEGDLIYVPQYWWHATIALGEGIGLSGQFVRRLGEILARVHKAQKEGRMQEAFDDLILMFEHRDELEVDVALTVATDVAVMHLQSGRKEQAIEALQMGLEISKKHSTGEASPEVVNRAEALLRDMYTKM